MLGSGAKIRVRRNGDWCMIENLQIGHSVYDPLADLDVPILDILSRTVSFDDAVGPKKHVLYPVIIPASALGAFRPNCDLLVSPGQEILTCRPYPYTSGRLEAVSVDASELELMDDYEPIASVKYHVIITQGSHFIDASGVLVKTTSSTEYPIYGTHSQVENLTSETKSRGANNWRS